MTITVYGAGAIGGITGARLAQAGHDVLLVDRAADHVAAMSERGLTIETRGGAVTRLTMWRRPTRIRFGRLVTSRRRR